MSGVLVVGTGDHARVIADALRAAGHQVAAFVEPDADGVTSVDGEPGTSVLTGLEEGGWLTERAGASFVVAIGANAIRRRMHDRCVALGLLPVAVVHPTAVLLGGARIDPGAQVCAGAVIGVAAHVGADAIVNTAASIDHDVAIGAHAFVGPGARLAGRVSVGEEAHVGIGAVVREGITIGAGALVAAGAVVVEDVAPGARVAGVPARPMEVRRE